MKKITLLLTIFLVLPLYAFAGSVAVPDYKKETELFARATCDDEKNSVEVYENDKYRLFVISMANGDMYYAQDYFDNKTDSLYFLKKAGSELQEMQEKEWNKAISKASFNVFLLLHATYIPQQCEATK